MAGSHEIAPEIHNGVSTLDEPSAAWGWHSIGTRAIQLSGWGSVVFLLAYNFGNHKGHVETIFLFVFAAVIALGLILQIVKPQGKQVRTLTAHNQPVGFKEKDWNYLQATCTGPYAELSDSELRALNIEPERVRHLRALPET
ncbi:DUF2631 domain-containing protein [Corynebacterium belfantii]|uniref:DUF2631 domain-containing protein n=1 Tax=Corynebacterium belfantii TaxID=2014537 RepID=A0ABS0LAF9_9CORY|nr:DUF2631 domain-containing protein [Corynebacterium belfantii]OLN16058.1 hypothetical protein BUE64_04620 [Corynebacterium diphtheriae subsp. lausannense]QVI99982.1 DUF2631 domain-containing protein [Corynebacterium diphtheriae]MBG9243281.1 DUF2631 domain-containing protein [Corynebacterium belfantii]MBG9258269.1 DUF2631 domain-containing protein [Corynebacterium belfantii]MBG9264827.1 DUF2631 domain-containing protein [Corynebacterium belfantii]